MHVTARLSIFLLAGAVACTVKAKDSAVDTSALGSAPVATAADTSSQSTQTSPPASSSPQPSQPSASDSSPAPAPTPTTTWTINPQGIGPLHAGMTVAQASAAAGGSFSAPPGGATGCTYAVWPNAPKGIFVMLQDGKVARVDVRNGTVATAAGARIGSTESRINALYAGKVVSTPHKYIQGGHYLTVTPGSGPYRLVFETDGSKVTTYRSGATPAVELVESCG